jgi:ABC-2 type transport system ATP-binding protein
MSIPLPATLDVSRASRRMGDRLVLDGVSLAVGRGRIVAVTGPNGAGKTSLMRAVAGRLRLDSGCVTIEGLSPVEARHRGRLGIVPQDIALYSHLTIRENLSVLARLSGVGGAVLGARVDEALTWAGLADRASALTHTLSGGMRRRANLVAGVLHRPALLLLDEPTVGVDAESESRLHTLLRNLRDGGMGLLVSTHNLDEAAAICDDVVVMHQGRVLAHGSLAEIVARAFSDGRELAVSVAAGPDGAARAMAAEGFRRTDGQTWVRPASHSLGDLGATQQRLLAAGVQVAEARLREPSLRGAIAVLTGAAEVS